MLAAGPCTFSSYRTTSSECALSGRWRWCWRWPRELGSWAGRAGQVPLLLGGWGTEYLVLGAGCDGALLQAAHWATHTGQHTLGMGCCPGRKVLVPASLFACCRVLVLCTAALALAGLAGIMAAASAHQVCEASNMILTWIFSLLFQCLITVVPRVEYGQVLPPLLTFYEAALMNIAHLLCYRILWYYLHINDVYMRRAKELQEAAGSTSRFMDVCCSYWLQAAAWH